MPHLKDTTIEVKWVLNPGSQGYVQADYDVLVIPPSKEAVYLESGLIGYTAPTDSTQGEARLSYVLDQVGLYTFRLSTGDSANFDTYSTHHVFAVAPSNPTAKTTYETSIPAPPPLLGYSGNSYDVSAEMNGAPADPSHAVLSTDGTKMFVSDNNASIFEYALTNAFDISSATYTGRTVQLLGQINTSQHTKIAFNPTGTLLFVQDQQDKNIYRYTLTTPWDVTTYVYSGNFANFSLQFGTNGLLAFALNSTGTRLYLLHVYSAYTIYQVDLATPWDLTSGTVAASWSYAGTLTDGAFGFAIAPNNTNFYLGDNIAKNIKEFLMSASGAISTSAYLNQFQSFADEVIATSGISVCADNSIILVGTATPGILYQYVTRLQLNNY